MKKDVLYLLKRKFKDCDFSLLKSKYIKEFKNLCLLVILPDKRKMWFYDFDKYKIENYIYDIKLELSLCKNV